MYQQRIGVSSQFEWLAAQLMVRTWLLALEQPSQEFFESLSINASHI